LRGRYGMGRRKSLGQNFLVSDLVRNRIIEALSLEEDELVFEIGPGRGALTGGLVESGARIVAVELDSDLFDRLKADFSSSERLEVINSDIRGFDFDREAEARGYEGFKVVGNIPYYLTSSILIAMTMQSRLIKAVLMVQREVADRILAAPGTRRCGTLTILLQSYFDVSRLMRVKQGSFNPPPKVESAVLALVPDKKQGAPQDVLGFLDVLKSFFSMRRKKLGSIFRELYRVKADGSDSRTEPLTALVHMRPEELSLSMWFELFETVSSLKGS